MNELTLRLTTIAASIEIAAGFLDALARDERRPDIAAEERAQAVSIRAKATELRAIADRAGRTQEDRPDAA